MGLLSSVVEQSRIPTIYVSTGRDLTVQVLPLRSIFVNFPMGNLFGRPHDVEMQSEILMHALNHAVAATEAREMLDLTYDWGESDDDHGNGVRLQCNRSGS